MPQGRGSGNFLGQRIYIDNKYLRLQSVEPKRVRHSCVHTHKHGNISREGTRERVAQWASLGAQLVKNPSAAQESACNTGDMGSVPGLGRSPGGGNSNPLQYSCLGNPMDRGFWWATVYGVTRVGHDLVTKPPPETEWEAKA